MSSSKQPKPTAGILKKLMLSAACGDLRTHVGSGVYGKVYRITMVKGSGEGDTLPEAPRADTPLDMIRTFVIKDIDMRHQNPKMKEILMAEVTKLKAFQQYDNFVHVEEDISAEEIVVERFCYAMEYCNLGSLRDVLSQGELILNEKRCQNLFRQLLTGLHAMYKRGYIHRDQKPENILLMGPNLDEVTLKIADFGFAKQSSKCNLDHYASQIVQSSPGSIFYFAPERWQPDEKTGESKYGFRAELYTAGMILFEMITGRHYHMLMPHEGFHQRIKTYVPWPDARHLLSLLLDQDTQKRCTASQALAHPWLARPAEVKSEPLLSALIRGGATVGSLVNAVLCPQCGPLEKGCRAQLLLQVGALGKFARPTAALNEEWDRLVESCLMPLVQYTDKLVEEGCSSVSNRQGGGEGVPLLKLPDIHNFLAHHMRSHHLAQVHLRPDPSQILECLEVLRAIDPALLPTGGPVAIVEAIGDVENLLKSKTHVCFGSPGEGHLKIACGIITDIAQGSITAQPGNEARELVTQATLVFRDGRWCPDSSAGVRYPGTPLELACFVCCLLEPRLVVDGGVDDAEALIKEHISREVVSQVRQRDDWLYPSLFKVLARLLDPVKNNTAAPSGDHDKLRYAYQEFQGLRDLTQEK